MNMPRRRNYADIQDEEEALSYVKNIKKHLISDLLTETKNEGVFNSTLLEKDSNDEYFAVRIALDMIMSGEFDSRHWHSDFPDFIDATSLIRSKEDAFRELQWKSLFYDKDWIKQYPYLKVKTDGYDIGELKKFSKEWWLFSTDGRFFNPALGDFQNDPYVDYQYKMRNKYGQIMIIKATNFLRLSVDDSKRLYPIYDHNANAWIEIERKPVYWPVRQAQAQPPAPGQTDPAVQLHEPPMMRTIKPPARR